ncbi:MAG TPA: hypothetical protein VHB50_20220 [Bryobacteraceae bacterium]|nr:hypothetical protein [Bryobacteraceae bacterium]
MKAFRFPLDQALRWRGTQVEMGKASVSAAGARLRAIQQAIESRRNETRNGALHLTQGATGSVFESWSAYASRSRREIAELEKQRTSAEQSLALEMHALVEANRRQHLLENLKHRHHAGWLQEYSKELEAFASESFVGRLQSIKRARSSGG